MVGRTKNVSVEASGECVPITLRRGRMRVNRQCVYSMNGESRVSVEIGREELDVPHRPGASRGNVCCDAGAPAEEPPYPHPPPELRQSVVHIDIFLGAVHELIALLAKAAAAREAASFLPAPLE